MYYHKGFISREKLSKSFFLGLYIYNRLSYHTLSQYISCNVHVHLKRIHRTGRELWRDLRVSQYSHGDVQSTNAGKDHSLFKRIRSFFLLNITYNGTLS